MFAQQLTPELQELAELERLAPKLVARELRPLLESLRERKKDCYRCQTETIGKVRPKRRQRHFCCRRCAAGQAREDFSARGNHAASAR